MHGMVQRTYLWREQFGRGLLKMHWRSARGKIPAAGITSRSDLFLLRAPYIYAHTRALARSMLSCHGVETHMSILIAGRRVLMIVVVTIGCSAALGASQAATAPKRGAIERGHALFEQSCATCHGKRGKGDARGASTMNPRPTDLTTLSKRYGAFPAERVEATLKGTDQSKAHTPTMMAWKALFLADANGNETTADAHVKDVIAFIASLQAK